MPRYKQLTREERYQIPALQRAGKSQVEISRLLKRSLPTINRELRRNRGIRGYRPAQAKRLAESRRRAKVSLRISAEHWLEVERLLQLDWIPEQIAGRLRRERGISISHEWIYRYILMDKHLGGALYRHLRCQKRKRKHYGGRIGADRSTVGSPSSNVRRWSLDADVWAIGKATH